MYKLLALSVLVSVALAIPAREKRAASDCLDAFKNVPNPCINNPNSQVYFPHPTDNSKFIQCDRYGRMYVIQCPDNLIYSATTSTCREQATAPPVVTNPAVVVTNAPMVSSSNPCTPEALAAGNIYFAVANDPTKFIECDMLGHANVLPCASGLIWNESRLSCVYPFDGTGTGGSGTGTGTGTGGVVPTIAGGSGTSTGDLAKNCTPENIANNNLFFPHPDPTKFIQCDLWGDVYVLNCPAGLVWNQYSETCASAYITVNGGK